MKFDDLPSLPFAVSDSVMQKASHIKLALFDVDGVLTDGRLYYGKRGEKLKVFHALDGHGLKMLGQAGITVAIITARQSAALTRRLQDLKITHAYTGVHDKVSAFETLLDKLKVNENECAFTGDDVIDLGVMQRCGLKFSVGNGHFVIKHAADWVSPFNGGEGAVRSICDLLLFSQNTYPIGTGSSQ